MVIQPMGSLGWGAPNRKGVGQAICLVDAEQLEGVIFSCSTDHSNFRDVGELSMQLGGGCAHLIYGEEIFVIRNASGEFFQVHRPLFRKIFINITIVCDLIGKLKLLSRCQTGADLNPNQAANGEDAVVSGCFEFGGFLIEFIFSGLAGFEDHRRDCYQRQFQPQAPVATWHDHVVQSWPGTLDC